MFWFYFLSFLYRKIRQVTISYFSKKRISSGSSPDLEDAVLFGDKAISVILPKLGFLMTGFTIPKDIGVHLHDLYFPSPLTFASFKNEPLLLEYWLRLGMGGGCLKSLTSEKREGNPRPRLQSVQVDGAEALINAMGLPSPGIDSFFSEQPYKRLFSYGRPIGISVVGETLDLYVQHALKILSFMEENPMGPYYIELNLSCPNIQQESPTKNLGALFSALQTIRKKTDVVLGVKVSPDEQNPVLCDVAKLLSEIDKSYLTIGNTSYRTKDELGLSSQEFSQPGGGLSGFPLFNRTLEMTLLLSKFQVPLIATGGISDFHQARAVLETGATLIGMATALIQDPYRVPIINRKLAARRKVHL